MKIPNKWAMKYNAKYRAEHEGEAREKLLKLRAFHRSKLRVLQRAIIRRFAEVTGPSLGLPGWILIGYPSAIQVRTWLGSNMARKLGVQEYLPTLFLPLISFERAHSCLWLHLMPTSNVRRTERTVASALRTMGHEAIEVRTIAEAEAAIINYMRGPD